MPTPADMTTDIHTRPQRAAKPPEPRAIGLCPPRPEGDQPVRPINSSHDVHIRIPAELLTSLDARLSRRSLPPTRTAAILQAVERWIDWDTRKEAHAARSSPHSGTNSPHMGGNSPHTDPAPRELTYERIDA